MKTEIEYINISKLINESDSRLLRALPNFVIRLIKRLVREKEINRILNTYSDYEGITFLPKIIDEFNLKVEVIGKENLPENGRCFFVANHPFGFADGLIVSSKYGEFKAIGNDVFMLVPHLKTIVAAVNIFGTNSKKYILELVLLPHEMFNKKNKTIRVKIGNTIPYQTFNKTKTHSEWAQFVKEQVYNLKN